MHTILFCFTACFGNLQEVKRNGRHFAGGHVSFVLYSKQRMHLHFYVLWSHRMEPHLLHLIVTLTECAPRHCKMNSKLTSLWGKFCFLFLEHTTGLIQTQT